MNREEIEQRIRLSMRERGLDANEPTVMVQRDPYHGWNIAVITTQFADRAFAERRGIVMPALKGLEISWVDLLTPNEVEWAGALPGDNSQSELPLWPEALARASMEQPLSVTMASDLDDDLEPPVVATFYSLRGGVGRSTALAHTARILASRGKKVVCVDMDLEAPALPVLLGCDQLLRDNQGVVDILMALDQGTTPDYAAHILPASQAENLFVVPAGRVSADYARKLRFVDPGAWYREDRNPLREMMEGLKTKLPFQPDAILLDARTGITDISGPLLFDISDLSVIVFFPHPQARRGTELLARSILRTTTGRVLANDLRVVPEIRFIVSPVPASSAPEVKQRYEHRALEWIDDWLLFFNEERARRDIEPIDSRDITHIIPYREDIATSDAVTAARSATHAFEPAADWIQRFLRTSAEAKSSLDSTKVAILGDLKFSAGTAEEQEGILVDFVQTPRVDEALSASIPVVLGRKGTGKTAVFRYLSERSEIDSVVVHAPSPLRGQRHWQLSPDGFAAVERVLEGSVLGWRHFWSLYTAVALDTTDHEVPRPRYLVGFDITTELDMVEAIKRTVSEAEGALELKQWLRRFDENTKNERLLLFDGLDTGFGSTEQERDRRRKSVEGLFDAWMDVGQSFANLRFKILLREDIWRGLNFANKSHLYGKTLTLKWQDQNSFLKVVIKQAMRSERFSKLPQVGGYASKPVDEWSDEAVQQAWIQLVGERMKGGQTAYTRNWVWNRLADSNADHSPRHLLQLFREALAWERAEERKSPYEKAVIRPRALLVRLATISEQAVSALREEFAELQPLLDTLVQVGRTPIDADTLAQNRDILPLAREVGLLGVYEESGDLVTRYKVPDLYRLGLGMTRKGQA